MENINNVKYKIGVSCEEKHVALFCLDDVIKNKNMIERNGYQCICLECGEFATVKNNCNNIVFSNSDVNQRFSEYYVVRNKYIQFVSNGLTPIDAVDMINIEYNIDNQNKVFKKTI